VPDVASARRIRALIDLTDLGPACTEADIERLCRRAVDHRPFVAAVCVWPRFVAQAARLLVGTGVKVATVVNFPSGGTDVAATLAETSLVLADGADEIDLVIPYRALLDGDVEVARSMVVAVRAGARAPQGDPRDRELPVTARGAFGCRSGHRRRSRLRQDLDRQDRSVSDS
jgi:deoxyribose-phosphate aldolase